MNKLKTLPSTPVNWWKDEYVIAAGATAPSSPDEEQALAFIDRYAASGAATSVYATTREMRGLMRLIRRGVVRATFVRED